MNVEIGTEAAQFPEKEYLNGIFLAVCISSGSGLKPLCPYTHSKPSFYNIDTFNFKMSTHDLKLYI
jgi:hypothetical protein